MGRFLAALAAGIVALVLLYPVECASGEFEPTNRCETVLGLSLPGFTYRGDAEYRVYIVPLAGTALAGFAAWRLAGRRRGATSRS